MSPRPLAAPSFWRRAAAKAIDVLTVVVAMVPVTALMWWRVMHTDSMLVVTWAPTELLAIGWVSFCLDVIIAESWLGRTLGKYALGLRVIQESGARITIGQSVVRQLPLFLLVFWIDVFFALFTERRQRAFELLSKTRVVLA